MQTILVILIWAVVQTSLSEEIFFRGFLGNRLFEKLGNGGNVIQAIIFGGIHIVSVVGKGILPMVIIFFLQVELDTHLDGFLEIKQMEV